MSECVYERVHLDIHCVIKCVVRLGSHEGTSTLCSIPFPLSEGSSGRTEQCSIDRTLKGSTRRREGTCPDQQSLQCCSWLFLVLGLLPSATCPTERQTGRERGKIRIRDTDFHVEPYHTALCTLGSGQGRRGNKPLKPSVSKVTSLPASHTHGLL